MWMKSFDVLFFCLLAFSAVTVRSRRTHLHRGRASTVTATRSPLGSKVALPSTLNCTWVYYEQTLDHFARGATRGGGETFSQRLCLFDGFVKEKGSPSVVLFYTGNESPVEEYVNNTGLMWEVGYEVRALLVFAEHRYEGESVPDQVGMPHCASYVTVEQSLADYAAIIHWLRGSFSPSTIEVPFVAVGGSYGGMLSSWLRIKYPFAVAGAIAASAPIFGFAKQSPPLDGSAVATSRGFSEAGGNPPDSLCSSNLLAAWPLMKQLGTTTEGRALLEAELGLCSPLASEAEVNVLLQTVQATFFDLSEGDYPFESTYITSAVGPGQYPLPAWPMRVACRGLNADLGVSLEGDVGGVSFTVRASDVVSVAVEWDTVAPLEGFTVEDVKATGVPALLRGIAGAWAVWCNVTGTLTCLSAGGCLTGDSDGNGGAGGGGSGGARSGFIGEVGAEKSEGATRKAVASLEGATASRAGDDDAADAVCTSVVSTSWDSLCCNDDLYLVNYLVQGVGRDVYWPPNVPKESWQGLNYSAQIASLLGPEGSTGPGCREPAGVSGYPEASDPWSLWLDTLLGGLDLSAASNILFSNGLLDPWSGAGVYPGGAVPPAPGQYEGPALQNLTVASVPGSLQSLILDLGAHHLDLMFMDDNDPPCADEARAIERDAIVRWADAERARTNKKQRSLL
mmetsp:Transcript_31186/g.62342  ORF Transcript_31186/g.62342 Transcript_31186/m.62342 type:complete len:680 (-) Transcript_31186:115-2154(-)